MNILVFRNYPDAIYDCSSTTGCRDAIDEYISFYWGAVLTPTDPRTAANKGVMT